MHVSVHYMAQIKRAAGYSSERIEIPDVLPLREFLQHLANNHSAGFRTLLLDDAGEPQRSLLFFVGDDHADLSRSLIDGDTVTILAPMAGG